MVSPMAVRAASLLGLVAAASALGLHGTSDFTGYVAAFGRNYAPDSEEYLQREALFQRRVEAIDAQNAKANRLWTAGFNAFTDRTVGELAQFRGWRHVESGRDTAVLISQTVAPVVSPPETVDWTNLSMAKKVPDQGACGSCWAVATSSMLEGRFEARRGAADGRTFSAQQLVDCVPNPKSCGGDGGCQGATVELAMTYVEQMGLKDNDEEPYSGVDGTCSMNLPAASFLQRQRANGGTLMGLESWSTLTKNKALPLMLALADGPVAISVAASPWFAYMNGVFDGCEKDAVIDHAVTLFGYGKDKDVKFWNIRNSWGSHWGQDGFIRLLRHDTPEQDDAHCGTDNDPGMGLACKPYPKSVEVCGTCGMLYDSVAASFSV